MINSNIRYIIKVTISNFLLLLSSVLTGFLLPKIMSLSDYGYYKTFTLYIAYSAIFRFGIVDGIYLRYGGVSYENLNISLFKFYSFFLIAFESCISIIMLAISLLFLENNLKYIFAFVSIYIWTFNITSYYQTLSQITKRFDELAHRNTYQALLNIVVIISLCFLYTYSYVDVSYKIYIFLYTLIQFALSIWYLFTYKEISFGLLSNIHFEFGKIFSLAKIGIPLLLANICSTLLLNLDRQFVNINFSAETYAKYAFAYNLLTLVTICTSAVSTIIYPILKRSNYDSMKDKYSYLVSLLLILVLACIGLYFPLCVFIEYYLPQYEYSLLIFKIIFPGIAFTSVVTVVIHNYYKTYGMNSLFMIISIVILFISLVSNIVVYKLWGTPIAISVSSVIIMFIWYLLADYYLMRKYYKRCTKNYFYMTVLILTFYLIANYQPNYFVGLLLYIIVYVASTSILFVKDYNKLKKIIM